MLQPSRVLSALALCAIALGASGEDARKPPVYFPGLKFRLVGPFVGGSFVVENDGVPTQGMREVYATQRAELDVLDQEWKSLLAGDLATLNKTAQPAIVIR